MLSKIQKYTIFHNTAWQIFLPYFIFVLSRYLFVLIFDNGYNFQTFIYYFFYPLVFDGLLMLLVLAAFQAILKVRNTLIIISIYYFFSNLIYFQHYKFYH